MGLKLNGATSGSIEIDVPAVAGTDTAITIPATTGGEFIVSDSSGNIDLGPLDINGGASDDSVNIDGSGRLLVGTSTQSSVDLFTVEGHATDGTNAAFMMLRRGAANPSGGLGYIRFADLNNGVGAQIDAQTDGTWASGDYPTRLVFSTTADTDSSPIERMRIGQNGFAKHSNAGSYFTSGGNFHEFRSNDTNSSTLVVSHHGSSGGQYGIYVVTADDQNDSTRTFLYCDGGSTARVLLRSNGGIANYSANNANLCDEREKKNIEALDSTWGCLKNWDLKKFHYNEDADTDDKRYGVIAQQVAPHCPEVITDWVKQRAEDAVLDDDGNVVTPAREEIVRMGVKEQQMMWMAIKALQEAQTRIETLEAKVAQLEGGAA